MEVLVTKDNFISEDIVDDFESLIWTDRYCGYGDFEIFAPVNPVLFTSLAPDYYLSVRESEHCMIIEDHQIKTDEEDGNHLIVTGRSLECIMERRIIWGQTVLTGSFQNGIQKLLNENIINPTIAARKIDNFIFEASTDPSITALTIEAQYNGENLYDSVKSLCAEKNIGFKVTLTDDNKFKFKLYSGVNRSYSQTTNPYVVFSPKFDNLLNSNYLESKKPLKTISLVVGVSDKSTTAEITAGGGSGMSRREMFTNASDITNTVDGVVLSDIDYLAQLAQRGKEELAENVIVKSFEGQVETNQLFTYGTDFFMGDIVQIANEYGIESESRVTEIVYSESDAGKEIHPTFATSIED